MSPCLSSTESWTRCIAALREPPSSSSGGPAQSLEYRRGGARDEQLRLRRTAAGESLRRRVPRSTVGCESSQSAGGRARIHDGRRGDSRLHAGGGNHVQGTSRAGSFAAPAGTGRTDHCEEAGNGSGGSAVRVREIWFVERRYEPLPLADADSFARRARVDESRSGRGLVPVRDYPKSGGRESKARGKAGRECGGSEPADHPARGSSGAFRLCARAGGGIDAIENAASDPAHEFECARRGGMARNAAADSMEAGILTT